VTDITFLFGPIFKNYAADVENNV